MRVTGDCLRDARAFVFAADFFIGLVDFFAALFRLAAGLDALFDAAFDALFALLLPRDAARFDAVDDLRRVFPPDDFDADAMINSSRKVRYNIAQDSRAMSSPMRDKKTTRRRPSRRSWSEPVEGRGCGRVAESPSRCGLQSSGSCNSAGRVSSTSATHQTRHSILDESIPPGS
jgi:hypothetical protein